MPQQDTKFNIIKRSATKGLHTILSPTEIDDSSFSAIQNMRFSRFGFGPRLGVDIVGSNANTHTTGIKSLYCFGKADGNYVLLRSGTTWLEWYDSVSDKWQTLVASLASGLRFGFAPFNLTNLTTIDNNLVFCNGTNNYSEWNGAIGNVSSTTVNTIVLTGSITLANLGFSTTGSVIINGTAYAYTGLSSQTFTGVTGDPTGEANGSGVAQIPDITTHSALPKGNILHSAMGRVWNSKDSAVRVAYSQSLVHTNFTSGDNYGDPGIEDFPEGDGPVYNITSKSYQNSNKVIIWKEKGIFTLALEIYAATTATSAKRPVRGTIVEGTDTGVASPLGVAASKFGEFYVSSRGGLNILGLTNEGNYKPNHLTARILPSLKDFNWQTAAVGYDPNENLIYASCRGTDAIGQTAVTNDTLVVYDIIRDALSIWKGLNISCFAYDPKSRKMYAGDVNQGLVYQMNIAGKFSDDIGSGERSPIIASALTKRYDVGLPALKKSFHLYYIHGYILPGAEIKVDFRYNAGIKKIITRTIKGDTTKSYIFTKPSNTFGALKFGDLAFGGEENDYLIEGMLPFRVYCKIPISFFFDLEVLYYSISDISGYWVSADGMCPVAEDTIDKSLILGD